MLRTASLPAVRWADWFCSNIFVTHSDISEENQSRRILWNGPRWRRLGNIKGRAIMYQQSPWMISDLSDWEAVINDLKIKPYPVKKGVTLYNQGDFNGKVYLIESGLINISITGVHGNEKCLFVLGSGCVFGEIGILSKGAKRTSATAVSPAVLYEIPGEYLLECLKTDVAFGQVIIDNLLKKMQLLTSHIELLSFHDSSYRVAENVIYLMEQFGKPGAQGGILIEMKLTHQEMANLVGVTRVTVTNVFLKLKKMGLVEKHKTGIYVKDPKQLREFVEQKRDDVL